MFRQNKNQPAADTVAAPLNDADIDALFSPFLNYSSLLLAVSGGSDSMALLHLAHKWRARQKHAPRFSIASINHGLRAEAQLDCAHVQEACQKRGLPFYQLNWEGEKPATGVQAEARGARYALLSKLAIQRGIEAIVVAHTQDDQAETVLMRLCRGSGLAGLVAMRMHSEKNGTVLLRPFLDVTREELRAVLRAAGVPWREDASNTDDRFLRPRLRGLLPQLAVEGLNTARLTLFAKKAARANAALDEITDTLLKNESDKGLALTLYRNAPEEIRLRVLKKRIEAISPSAYPPGDDSLEQLDEAILSQDAVRRTLGGALIEANAGFLRFFAENDPRKPCFTPRKSHYP